MLHIHSQDGVRGLNHLNFERKDYNQKKIADTELIKDRIDS